MRTLLSTLRQEFDEKMARLGPVVQRDLVVPDIPNKIKVLVGMRRTGKTYYLFQKIQELQKKGIPTSQILFLSLEDDRLDPQDGKTFAKLVEAFYSEYPENHNLRCYLFFDEIHVVHGWSQVIRRFQDTKNVEIYLTGSSAKLLSKEIATELRGRSLAYEVWPFSFQEFLRAKNIPWKIPKSQMEWDMAHKHLETYLMEGGFPEVTLLPFPEKEKILRDYVDVVMYRDIIERHQISNFSLIKYLIRVLLKNPATPLAINKLYQDLKSQGYGIGRSTVYEYVDHIQDAYLVSLVPMFSESVRKVQSNPKKLYTVDSGLSAAYTFSRSNNLGHAFENMIYLDLRRQGREVYYYQTEEKYEVDFLTRDEKGELELYQVAWHMEDPKTQERETRALEAGQKELGTKGRIITPTTYLGVE